MPRFPDDPPGVPLEYVGRLGRTWFIDTNIAGDESPAVQELFELRGEGWVRLVKADMLDTELAFDEDHDRRARLQTTVADVEELLGPLVWGHSRWDHSVWGSEHDQVHIDKVFALLFPHKERTTASDNDVRDGLHVATALRYGADGFLTNDKAQLKRDAAFREVHNGFSIRRPEDVLPFIHRLIDRDKHRRVDPDEGGQEPSG